MITSHGYVAASAYAAHPHQQQQHHVMQPASAASDASAKPDSPLSDVKSEMKSETSSNPDTTSSSGPMANSVGSDPFNPLGSSGFGSEDDFDINIPPAALQEEGAALTQQQQQQQQQQYHQQNYHHQQQQQHYGYPAHAQHQQQQQWAQHHHHQQQQQHYQMNGYQQHQYSQEHQQHQQYYGYNAMYHHNGAAAGQHAAAVPQGGPSPVGSHNTPSPQAHSEDGDEHVKNNNVLKRPSPDHHQVHAAAHHMQGQVRAQGILQVVPTVHHHQHHHQMPHSSPLAKKPKVSKRKKKRDPNEPQKPVSAYALFFRDSQASIKVANPNAAFGDVSKIVASMWDNLDPDSKAMYKKRTENAKKEYLKKLAAYRASLVSKGGGDPSIYGPYAAYAGYGEIASSANLTSAVKPAVAAAPTPTAGGYTPNGGTSGFMGQPIPPRPPMQHGMHHHHHQQQQQQQHPGYMAHHHQQAQHPNNGGSSSSAAQQPPSSGGPATTQTSSTTSPHTPPISSPTATPGTNNNGETAVDAGAKPSTRCGRPGCGNPVQWTGNHEYCSNECVAAQCRDVYTHWSGSSAGQPGQAGQQQGQYAPPGAPAATSPQQAAVK